MRKSLNEYMNDPDIVDEPMALREIHAIRLRIHDETKKLTPEEHTAYFHAGAEQFMVRKETSRCRTRPTADLKAEGLKGYGLKGEALKA